MTTVTFLYYVYTMEYVEAISYMKNILQSKNLRLRMEIARKYRMVPSHITDLAKVIVSQTEDMFYEERKNLVNRTISISDKDTIIQGLKLVRAVHGDTYFLVCGTDTHHIVYEVSFENADIVVDEAQYDPDLGAFVRKVSVVGATMNISNPYDSVQFMVSEDMTMNKNPACTLYEYMTKLVSHICWYVRRSPFRFIPGRELENEMDAVRMFNLVWPDNIKPFLEWAEIFAKLHKGPWQHNISEDDEKHLEFFAVHPHVEIYEDADGKVFYTTLGNMPILIAEKVNNGLRIADEHCPTYNRWKLMSEMAM